MKNLRKLKIKNKIMSKRYNELNEIVTNCTKNN